LPVLAYLARITTSSSNKGVRSNARPGFSLRAVQNFIWKIWMTINHIQCAPQCVSGSTNRAVWLNHWRRQEVEGSPTSLRSRRSGGIHCGQSIPCQVETGEVAAFTGKA
jgi:hypothetical protein